MSNASKMERAIALGAQITEERAKLSAMEAELANLLGSEQASNSNGEATAAPPTTGTGSKPGSLPGRILAAISAPQFPKTWGAEEVRAALGEKLSGAVLHSALTRLRRGNRVEKVPGARGRYRVIAAE